MCENRMLAEEVRVATGPVGRARGLIGRGVPPSFALAIPGAKQVHTFGMRSAIDVLFCDSDLRVLHVERHLPARRFSRWVKGSKIVLELAAGQAEGVGVGAALALVPHCPYLTARSDTTGRSKGEGRPRPRPR